MTRHSPITKFPKPRDIAAQARLFAEVAADCSRGILSGDYSEAGISAFAAETTELFRAMRAEVEEQRARQPRQPRKPPRPSVSKMIEQAEKATGKPVTSITLPDGTKLDFSKPEAAEPDNPWRVDEFRTEETKQ
jgi:hypothetical protein